MVLMTKTPTRGEGGLEQGESKPILSLKGGPLRERDK
jgi:hypothetical protein